MRYFAHRSHGSTSDWNFVMYYFKHLQTLIFQRSSLFARWFIVRRIHHTFSQRKIQQGLCLSAIELFNTCQPQSRSDTLSPISSSFLFVPYLQRGRLRRTFTISFLGFICVPLVIMSSLVLDDARRRTMSVTDAVSVFFSRKEAAECLCCTPLVRLIVQHSSDDLTITRPAEGRYALYGTE